MSSRERLGPMELGALLSRLDRAVGRLRTEQRAEAEGDLVRLRAHLEDVQRDATFTHVVRENAVVMAAATTFLETASPALTRVLALQQRQVMLEERQLAVLERRAELAAQFRKTIGSKVLTVGLGAMITIVTGLAYWLTSALTGLPLPPLP